jgi:hypothetical protein
MSIYICVKQHTNTKLKYFCKTKKNPEKYNGSGVDWKKHLSENGKYVINLQIWEFERQDVCTRFCLWFSKKFDIVESDEWANKIPENGIGGGSPKGTNKGKASYRNVVTNEVRQLKTDAIEVMGGEWVSISKGRKYTEEQKKISSACHWALNLPKELNLHTGMKRPKETGDKISAAKKGVPNIKLRGRNVSNETKLLQSNIRKGNNINLTEETQNIRLQLYKKILDLYDTVPLLHIPYDYIAKNGKFFHYKNAFAKVYCVEFGVTSKTILNVLDRKILLMDKL